MKELGEKFKEAREKTGISLEEAAIDLEYKVSQLEEIENGNYKDFKDKFLLKTIISDYAKYLGFDPEEIIDEFNTFVFESTSKIPIDEIAKASKNMNKDTDDQIASPYTATEEPKKVPEAKPEVKPQPKPLPKKEEKKENKPQQKTIKGKNSRKKFRK